MKWPHHRFSQAICSKILERSRIISKTIFLFESFTCHARHTCMMCLAWRVIVVGIEFVIYQNKQEWARKSSPLLFPQGFPLRSFFGQVSFPRKRPDPGGNFHSTWQSVLRWSYRC